LLNDFDNNGAWHIGGKGSGSWYRRFNETTSFYINQSCNQESRTMNVEKLDSSGAGMTPTDYEVLPLNTLWPEIHPHCSAPGVQALMNTSVRNWIKDHGWVQHKPEKDTWNILGALCGKCSAPWELGSSDYWCEEIDRRIEEGVVTDDPLAMLAKTTESMYCMIEEVRSSDSSIVSDKERKLISELYTRTQAAFEPKPESLDWWAIRHACHYVAPFALALAQHAYPDGDWEIVEGNHHSTVVDHLHRRCFDILLYDYKDQRNHVHPLELALQTGPKHASRHRPGTL
jgi:hypothetical protein